ncbi:hypothetical protein QX776_00220 [Alteromonadaceae bacterium BrNp21-10]|nr:hypothetical protein [Alteromonadaceae bacterium BrNp21-10]
MNWKTVFIGGAAFYIVQLIISMITGGFIHQGVLVDAYAATASVWRPELIQSPPDLAALMPMWITTGIVVAFVQALVFDQVRDAFNGSGVIQGLKFGLMLFVLVACTSASWSGVFNLPLTIWCWWLVEGLAMYLIGGMALGAVAAKLDK